MQEESLGHSSVGCAGLPALPFREGQQDGQTSSDGQVCAPPFLLHEEV